MIRDIVRTACIIATMAAAASLAVDARLRFAAIDAAHRQAISGHPVMPRGDHPITADRPITAAEPRPLWRLGAAAVGLAEALIGLFP